MSIDYDAIRKMYMREWKATLGNLLGWSEERVERWAKRFENGLSGRDDWFTHEDALYYAAYLLAPKNVWRSLDGLERLHLGSRLAFAIRAGGPGYASRGCYSWEAAKDRINAILAEHGESLDTVIDELGDDGELHWQL